MSDTTTEEARFIVKHSPTTPLKNLVGLAEFADAGHVTYNTITAYRTRGRLPEPAAMLGRVPVWTRRQLASWLSARRGTVGARP